MPTTVMLSNQKASGNSASLDVSQVSEASIFILDGWHGSIRFMASIDGGNTFPIPVTGVDKNGNQIENLLGDNVPVGGIDIGFPDCKRFTTLRLLLTYGSGAVYATGYADPVHASVQVVASTPTW